MPDTQANSNEGEAGASTLQLPQDVSDQLLASMVVPECKVGPRPRNIETGTDNFNLGALILSCQISDKEIQNAIVACASSAEPNAMCQLMVDHPLPLVNCSHSLYSRVIMMFLNPNFLPSVTDAQIAYVLKMKVSGFPTVSMDTPYSKCYSDTILQMLSALRLIAIKLQHTCGTPEIKIYQDVVDVLVRLPRWQQIMIDDCITVSSGALINLATNITLKNFNWFMGKLKLATSVELIDKILRSPSVVGKCTALWKLLEIHEMIWHTIDWAAFEGLVSTLYTIISWLMDKCKMAKEYAKEGWMWVSAKFRREPGEANKYPQAGAGLPEFPVDNASQQMMAEEDDGAARLLEQNQQQIEELEDPPQEVINAAIEEIENAAIEQVEQLKETTFGRDVIEWIKKAFGDVVGFFKENPIVGGFVSLLITLAGGLGITISEFKTSGDKKSFFKKVSNASKDMFYLQRGKESFWGSIKDFFQIAKETAGIVDEPEVVAFKETLSRLMDSSETMVTECQSNPGRFVNDPIKFHEFRREIDAIRKQYRDVIRMSPTVNLSVLNPIWQQLNKNYNSLLGMWTRHMTATGMRPRPVLVWLYGETQVGKSEFANWIVDEYNKVTGNKWQTFTISKGPEFWNGFSQQQVIKIDDFMSFVGPEGALDALAVMNLITCADFNPSIAALDDKLIRATPSLVIVCANFPTVPMNCGIMEMKAFEGRRELLLNVTWPAHATCPIGVDCEHIRQRDEANANLMDDWSHLVFTATNPLVNSRVGARIDNEGFGDAVAIRRQLAGGQHVDVTYTPNEIIQIIREKIDAANARHLTALRRREANLEPPEPHDEEVVQEAEGDITDWKAYPNMLLSGAPGIGKSKVLELVRAKCDHFNKEYLYIVTLADFESFASANFITTKKVVFIEDCSSIYKSPKFPDFMRVWKERVDKLRTDIPLWIVAMNREVLEEHYGDVEIEVLERRAVTIEFHFRQKWNLYFFGKCYDRTDVRGCKSEEIDDYVLYLVTEPGKSECKMTNSGLVEWIFHYEHESNVSKIATDLDIKTELQYQTMCSIPLSSGEFINMMNTPGSVTSTITRLLDGKFSSTKYTKIELGRKILKTFKKMTHVAGTYFCNMDSFILCGINGGFFKEFHGSNYVLSFSDKAYYIETVGEGVTAGIYMPDCHTPTQLAEQVGATLEGVNQMDFMAVSLGNLPSWFMLAGDVLAIIMRMGFTFGSIASSLSDNTALFRAIQMEHAVNKAKDDYLDHKVEQVGVNFERIVNPPYGETPSFAYDEPKYIPQFETPSDTSDKKSATPKSGHKRGGRGGGKKHQWKFARGFAQADVTTEPVDEIVHFINDNSIDTAKPQIMLDPMIPTTVKAVVKNCVEIVNGAGKRLVYGLMIYDRTGTTVHHVCTMHNRDDLYIKTVDGQTHKLTVVLEDEIQDRMNFTVGMKCPAFRNITSHLIPGESSNLEDSLAVLITVTRDHDFGAMPCLQMRYYRLQCLRQVAVDKEKKKVCSLRAYVGNVVGFGLLPPIETKAGDCGSVLLVCDPKRPAKVVGLHAAANNQTGYARLLTREMFIDKAEPSCALTLPTAMNEFEPFPHEFDYKGNPVVAKCVSPPFKPEKTKLYTSPFAYGDCEYEPAVLSSKDPRAPDIENMLYQESMKWLKPKHEFSDEVKMKLKAMAYEIGDYYGQKALQSGLHTKKLTKREALNSVSGFSHSQPIVTSTSPGYPWRTDLSKGKTSYIEIGDDGSRFFLKNAEVSKLFNAIDALILKAKKGKRGDVAFSVCLKDELLKKEKLKTKTRTIAAAPLHYTIAMRQYFHTIYAAICELWAKMPVQVGISANSLDWHTLFSRLISMSDEGWSLDHKDYDFGIPLAYVEAMSEFYNAFARITDPDWCEEDDVTRAGLHKNLEKFYFIVNGLLYQSEGGVASGHPGTAVENSILSILMLYHAWCEICPDETMKNFETFMEFVMLVVYGDDVKATVHRSARFFSLTNIVAFFKNIGMTVTHADKTSAIQDFYPIENGPFLSRTFRMLNGYYVGPLEMHRLIKPLNFAMGRPGHHWYKAKKELCPQIKNCAAAARSALDEMFLHGEEKYEDLRRHCITVSSEFGVEEYYPPYKVAFREFFGVPDVENPGIMYNDFPISQRLVADLQRERGWISYQNRRSLNFGPQYSYGSEKTVFPSRPIPACLVPVLNRVNDTVKANYNSVLVNVYEPGGGIPFHKDNEPELDLEEGVACVTIIGDGKMIWQREGNAPIELQCKPEFIYVMKGDLVTKWSHCRTQHTRYTMTLTFRKIRT